MKRVYNKLVRDNIPEIIRNNNETPITKTLNNEEYFCELKAKLQEEVDEFLESNDIAELADILEIIDALSTANDSSLNEVMDIKMRKAKKNGKFENKIFLIEVQENK